MAPNKMVPPANIFWQPGQSAAGTQGSTELGASDPAWQGLRTERARSQRPSEMLENDTEGLKSLLNNDVTPGFDEYLSQLIAEYDGGQGAEASGPAHQGQGGDAVDLDYDEEDVYGVTPPRSPAQGHNG